MCIYEHLTTIERRLLVDNKRFDADEEKEADEACAEFQSIHPDEEYLVSESVDQAPQPQLCEVCMKVVDHPSSWCPYLNNVPNPDNTPVGEGYKIYCHHCRKSDHGHPDGTWKGYAFKESWIYPGMTETILRCSSSR